jgi:hypothetical protein
METAVLQASYHQRFTNVTEDVTGQNRRATLFSSQYGTGTVRTAKRLEITNCLGKTGSTHGNSGRPLLAHRRFRQAAYGKWGQFKQKCLTPE